MHLQKKTLALEYQHQLAVNVRILRTWRGWPQQVLGDLLGWSRCTIIRIENGTRCPSYGQVCVLADILGVSTEDLRKDLSEVYSAANAGTLPDLLRKARLDQNLSQAELAADCGITLAAYREVESGSVAAEPELLRKLSSRLGRVIQEPVSDQLRAMAS